MMKKGLLIVVVCCFVSLVSNGQAIVHDPVTFAEALKQTFEMAKNTDAILKLERAQKRVEQMQQAVGWVKKLQSFQRIAMLVETTTCTLKDFNFHYQWLLDERLLTTSNSCWFQNSFNMNDATLNSAVDGLNLAIESNSNVNPSDRAILLDKAIENFKSANLQLGQLNEAMQNLLWLNSSLKRMEYTSDMEMSSMFYRGYMRSNRVKRGN